MMRLPAIVLICVMSAATVSFAQTVVTQNRKSAKLIGAIRSALGSTLVGNGEPLVGAGISAYENSGSYPLVGSTLSEAPRGSYEIAGLTPGKEYWVVFCKEKYFPRYTKVMAPSTVNIVLIKRNQDKAQWNAAAAHFVDFNVKSQTNEKSFEESWEQFLASGISAEGKAYVAHDVKDKLQHKPELWGDVSTFKLYAAADPEKLDKAERAIWLNTNDPVVFTLDPMIIQDIRDGMAKVQPAVAWKPSPTRADPCAIPYQ